MSGRPAACDACLARSWLLDRLGAHLERVRNRIQDVLSVADAALIDAVGGRDRDRIVAEFWAFNAEAARARAAELGLEVICRCEDAYPAALLALGSPPAALHVAGGLVRLLEWVEDESVAVVGARSASDYGTSLAGKLGRGLGVARVGVVSGMALGIDSAAHAGVLGVSGRTVAVLPAGAERAYPASKRELYRSIIESGVAVSELPPGATVRRWTFPARNRIIAGLTRMTVVVEAGPRSGSLVTARIAAHIGRPVGAVPGRVGTRQAEGTNGLLADGAFVVRDAQDVVDRLFGAGKVMVRDDPRRPLEPAARALLEAIAAGRDTMTLLNRAGVAPDGGLAALAHLELEGYVRRGPGGRFVVIP